MTSGFDERVCMLSYPDGEWLFTMPQSTCQGTTCKWNVFGLPYITEDLPAWFDGDFSYNCDNRLHDLGWKDPENPDPNGLNRYICACGSPLSDATKCENRCDRPWQPSFGQRCNFFAQNATAKGIFTASNADPSRGACTIMSAKASTLTEVDKLALATGPMYIDQIGITFTCDGTPFQSGRGPAICDCTGELPTEALGRTIEDRDPCQFGQKKEAQGWIAGPVLGSIVGLAVIVAIGVSLYRVQRRRRRSKAVEQEQMGDIELRSLPQTHVMSPREHSGPPSVSSGADSGVGLLNAARGEETTK